MESYADHRRTAPGVHRAYDVISFGKSASAHEGCGFADEGEEMLGLAFVAAVGPAATAAQETVLSTTRR